ncbi:MAG: hypothetical protein AAGF12_27370 [Myxococcota bacterium]
MNRVGWGLLVSLGALALAGSATAQDTAPAVSPAVEEGGDHGLSEPSASDPPSGSGSATPREAQANRADPVRRDDAESRPRENAPESDEEPGPTIFWLEGVAGLSYVDLISFDQDNFVPEPDRVNGVGFTGGAAAGIRLFIFTLGARATFSTYDAFDLGTVAADLGLRIPTPIVDIYARVGAGYAWMGRADLSQPANSEDGITGFMVDAGAGFDIYFLRHLALGLGLDFAFLNMAREAGCTGANCVATVDFTEEGNSAGFQLRFLLHLRFEV